jgi:hypothetical protein
MSKRNPFVRDVFTFPYRFKCCCYCALSVKTFSDKVEVALAGVHTASSHSRSSGILSVKQRSAVKTVVRSSPHSVGRQVHARTSAQKSAFRLTVQARKLSRALFGVRGRRLWRKAILDSYSISFKGLWEWHIL